MRFRKRTVWVCVIVLTAILIGMSFLPPIRVEWHKWRLEAAKARKERLLSTPPRVSWWDRTWKHVTGNMPAIGPVNQTIQRHENALVKQGFLQRKKFGVPASGNDDELRAAVYSMKAECPWYSAEAVSSSNLVVTACKDGMEKWRRRARDLGLEP